MSDATEKWEHAGLDCELKPTPGGIRMGLFNGYVKVPASHRP